MMRSVFEGRFPGLESFKVFPALLSLAEKEGGVEGRVFDGWRINLCEEDLQ